jgi:hypothetical protein
MIKFISIIILLLSGCAHSDNWTRADTMMQLGVTAVLIGDAVTTARIQDHPNTFENGPWAKHALGLHPDPSDVYLYFASVIVIDYLITRALPAEWRPYWQGWEIAAHGYAIINNCNVGLC